MEKKIIAVIGGGAAGMMSAIFARQSFETENFATENSVTKNFDAQNFDAGRARVILFEKNRSLGAKVLISGGGRCNITSGITAVKEVLQNYPRGEQFLKTAMHDFSPSKVMEWFEEHGVSLKIEEDLRVFPKSDDGKEVVGALKKALFDAGVEIRYEHSLKQVSKKKSGIFEIIFENKEKFEVDELILTTGGSAYRFTGSTGDGYAFAESLGHKITKLSPSLHSFVVQENYESERLSGISFDKAAFKLYSFDEKRVFERRGPFLFTHTGVSGPAIFALSSLAAYEEFSKQKPLKLAIDLFSELTTQELDQKFIRLATEHGKKNLINFLDQLLPKTLAQIIIERSGINPLLHTARISKNERFEIIQLMKGLTFQLVGRSGGSEFVTAGGINLEEINKNTMESKICPGLFFGGEIMDIDGFTGGFNLQASWATGRLAGLNAAKKLKQQATIEP